MIVKKEIESKKEFTEEQYMEWFRSMQLIRRFEEKAGQLYGQQKIRGFCHLYIGQEACAVGAVSALEKDDKYITAYRDHGHPLALGTEPKKVMAELFGKATGVSKGKGGSMHMFDKNVNFMGVHGIVGAQIPLGAGIGFAEQYLETKNVCICYMGDGAVRQGAFHEALNMAMTMKMPTIFVVENNGYAMGTSVQRTSNVIELHTLAQAYDMPSEGIDAMKVEEVHNSVKRAADRARKGDGPTFLEFRTYRYKGHSMSDPAKYRTKNELEEYKSQDPIEQVKQTMFENKWATEDQLKKIDQEIKNRVVEAVKFAEDSPWPEALEAYTDNYVEADYPFINS
ncbi:MAG: pyruvate dehydrogenase (acetyl-transferring) E1 component subunit alpha [Bacteroidota bacterium]